jgi:hypothetical protein
MFDCVGMKDLKQGSSKSNQLLSSQYLYISYIIIIL